MTIKSASRFIAVFTAVLLMFSVFTAFSGVDGKMTVHAASEVSMSAKATVTEGPLNVRSGPGTNYSRLGQLAKGKTVAVVSKVTNSSGNVWYKYKYSSSKYGYIYSQYVSISGAASETALTNKKATVTEGPLNVRSGPGTSYSKLGKLAKGASVTIVSQVTSSSGSVWYKYKYNSSTYGYLASQYVTVSNISSTTATVTETALTNKKATVTEGPLNVRSGPGTSYSKLGKLAKGASVTIVSKVKNSSGQIWYKYKYNSSKYGYVLSSYVKVSDIPQNVETALSNKQATVVEGPLNVRSGPGTNYSKLGQLAQGKKVTLISQVKNTSGNIWYKYQFGDGKYGYIYSQYVTVSDIPQNVETTLSEKIAYVAEGPLNVRTGPGTEYDRMGQLTEGTTVPLISQIKNTAGNIWYKFQTSDGKYGYIYSQYVTLKDAAASPEEPEAPEVVEPAEPVTFQMGTVTTDSGYTLNVRSGAGTEYSKLGSLGSGAVVTVIGSKKASNGKVWYQYQFSSSKVGYICSDYVKVQTVTSSSEFEANLTAQGFPESYKPGLRALHAAHPEWVFKAYSVGCTWSTAVSKENAKPSINVVSPSSPTSYRSKDSDCYSSKNGWSRYDGSWYSAHTDVIEYYMDPRNFLDETGIYQFMTQQYDASTQSADTVAAVIDGTFMETRNPGGGYSSFAPLINDAGKASGVNPNVLAAMIIQEQGVKGSSGLISGTYSGYKGYYNFFNVGAYTTSTMTAVQRGLWYASQSGDYGRPWNTVYKSILGGAQFYAKGYVNNNQYTYYTKKFNVKNGVNSIATHQYMTNVAGAYGEGKLLKNAFPDDYNGALVFEIPVYSSMPASACPLP